MSTAVKNTALFVHFKRGEKKSFDCEITGPMSLADFIRLATPKEGAEAIGRLETRHVVAASVDRKVASLDTTVNSRTKTIVLATNLPYPEEKVAFAF